MAKYWIVGAWWEGTEQDQFFVQEGIWMLGKENEDRQTKLAFKIQPGDRIAIKRMRGRGQKGIRILHLGIVKSIIPETNCFICTVNWVATNLNRYIGKSRGAFQSIHGPYKHDSEHTYWIREIFCL